MQKIKKYLKSLDDEATNLESFEIASRIKEIVGTEELSGNNLLEFLAFSYFESGIDKDSSWDMYFGPEYIGTNKDGSIFEFPSRETITENAWEYYKKRAEDVKNSSLKYRYSNLANDFGKKLGKKLDIKFVQIAIDSAVELCTRADLHGVLLIKIMRRCVSLAKSINDKTRLENLKKTSIKLEKKIGEDESPGLWGFTLDIFFFADKLLSEKELKQQISAHKQRLDRLAKLGKPWAVQCMIELLLKYYSINKDCSEQLKLLEMLYETYHSLDNSNDHPIKVLHYLEEIETISHKYADCTEVKNFATRIQKEINEYDPQWDKHLKEFSVKLDIDQEKTNKFVNNLFGSDKYNVSEVLPRIVVNFIQKSNAVESQLLDLQKNYPFQYLASRQIIGNEGKIIADADKYERFDFIQLYSQNMQIHDYFLGVVFQKFTKRFNKTELKDELVNCILIKKEDYAYLEAMLDSVYSARYVETCATVIPFIEKLIRRLCELNKETIYKPDEHSGGYKYVTLNELLMLPSLPYVFTKLGGDDVVNYLKISLTSKMGLNLRNDFAHGENLNHLNEKVAYRLLHILFLLSLVKKNPHLENS